MGSHLRDERFSFGTFTFSDFACNQVWRAMAFGLLARGLLEEFLIARLFTFCADHEWNRPFALVLSAASGTCI